jgi:hypothetical protein
MGVIFVDVGGYLSCFCLYGRSNVNVNVVSSSSPIL